MTGVQTCALPILIISGSAADIRINASVLIPNNADNRNHPQKIAPITAPIHGKEVQLAAGRNIALQASAAAGENDVTLTAGNDITVDTAGFENT